MREQRLQHREKRLTVREVRLTVKETIRTVVFFGLVVYVIYIFCK